MKRVIVFGIGSYYQGIKEKLREYKVIAFADNNLEQVGRRLSGIEVISPKDITKYDYDYIIIASQYKIEISHQLIELGVDESKIIIELDNKVKTTLHKEGGILYDIDGIKTIANTICDITTIHEIFKKNIYGVQSNNDIECVVIDIGLNVGNAALYFARNENIKRIYGFEPFEETYKLALNNINMNSEYIKNKIQTYNIGLGNENKKVKVNYNEGFSGVNSIVNGVYSEDESLTEIEERKASEILEPILEKNSDKCIIFKIDCEGSEYNIFKSLEEKDLTRKIDIILMEWHKCSDGGFYDIRNYLQSKGFIVILSTNDNNVSFVGEQKIGMLYAFRQK